MVITEIHVLHHSLNKPDGVWYEIFKYDMYSPWLETEPKCQRLADEYGREVRVTYEDRSVKIFLPRIMATGSECT